MSHLDHSFDWKGFNFSLIVIALSLFLGIGTQYGLGYAQSYFSSDATTDLIAVDATPHQNERIALLGSSTPQRIINSLRIPDVIPSEGKFIAADLVAMKLYLYQDGTTTATYPIVTKGRPGTPWETPSGFYDIQTKEATHFSTIGKVFMPYSMQFYGNYFLHGRTYYPNGALTSATFSGGCIKLDTADAQKVFAFADVGTKLFVYDSKETVSLPSLVIEPALEHNIQAGAYLVADMDTGDVYSERNAKEQRPIASVTKLMTALVANEIISFDKKLSVPQGYLINPPNQDDTQKKTFAIGELLYPLLMQSSNHIADSLASYYGPVEFMRWMNATAVALGMTATTFADTSGISSENISTTEDLFRLAVYLANKKSFVLDITRTQTKTITAEDGSTYEIGNVNAPADIPPFVGGKVGHTTAAKDTMVSVLSLSVGGDTRRVAVIVLGSDNQEEDTNRLADWILRVASRDTPQTACVTCASPEKHRVIEI